MKRHLFFLAMVVFFFMPSSLLSQSTEITIEPGWNWIGFPITETMQFEDVVNQFTPCHGDIIKSYKDGFSIYDAETGWALNVLKEFRPGKGYMYKYHGTEPYTFEFHAITTPPTPPEPIVPEGTIEGKFTANEDGDQVYFSKGNLQYQASTNTWRFAENQWDFVGSTEVSSGETGGTVEGSSNHLMSSSYGGWIDLFGWGTSGFNHGAVCYQPWSTSTIYSDYYIYDSTDPFYDLSDESGQADWGYNAIENGGNQPNMWRALTDAEWEYLFFTRTTSSGMRFVKATVAGSPGVILLPDDWNAELYDLSEVNVGDAYYNSNIITGAVWQNVFEAVGSVFLPAAGYRNGDQIAGLASYAYYWSSVHDDAHPEYEGNFANCLRVTNSRADMYFVYRYYGLPVRLVLASAASQPTVSVTTTAASHITSNSATCGGEITKGSEHVTSVGVCWSATEENPTIDDSHMTLDMGAVINFSCFVMGLEANTLYHARAYVMFYDEIFYGNTVEFTTLTEPYVPTGAIGSGFSVNENGDMVLFSQGNLQYHAVNNEWRFAPNQYDIIGDDNSNIAQDYNGWIDLFAWGTSNYPHNSNGYRPWYDGGTSDYYAYDDPLGNLFDHTGKADWGYNAISNGGNAENQWRTLTKEEWEYILTGRNTSAHFVLANVHGINGLILLPDNWNSNVYSFTGTDDNETPCNSNVISDDDWTDLETFDCVFLPLTGRRVGNYALNFDSSGNYWSSTCRGNDDAYYFTFMVDGVSLTLGGYYKSHGFAVRLVCTAE